MTDGDEGVVEALRENITLNELDGLDEERVRTGMLRWGGELDREWVEENGGWPYDVIIGADIVSIPLREIW